MVVRPRRRIDEHAQAHVHLNCRPRTAANMNAWHLSQRAP
jgi:hypothetical protein